MSIYKYQPVYDRIMEAGEYKNASALSRDLNITPQALSNYKVRDRMPLNLIHRFSEMYLISLDWLCYGEGKRARKVNNDQ